jgi:hypothetical protein
MFPSYRFRAAAAAFVLAHPWISAGAQPDAVFKGYITDTECGANYAPMIAKGGMGKDDRECTVACVSKGATFGSWTNTGPDSTSWTTRKRRRPSRDAESASEAGWRATRSMSGR